MSDLPRGLTVRRDAGLYGYERALRRHGLDPIAGRRRGGSRSLRRSAGGRRRDPPGDLTRHRAGPRRLQAADAQGARALLRPGRTTCAGVVGGRRRARGVRPARHARRQRGGAATGAGPARRTPVVRADRRVPRRRAGGAGPRGLEGRPGRRLHRGGLGDREGDPRPDHDRPAPHLPGLRLRDPQGLHHRHARGGARRARTLRGPPPPLRQRAPGRGRGGGEGAGEGAESGDSLPQPRAEQVPDERLDAPVRQEA